MDGWLALNSLHETLRKLAFWLIPALALLSLSGLIPAVDSTHPPYFNLDTTFAAALYWLTESGGFPGAVFVILLALLVFAIRQGNPPKLAAMEMVICVLAMTLLAGGGSKINEHAVKDRFAVPRPNISDLVKLGAFSPKALTTESFYSKYPSKESRGEAIQKAFTATPPPMELGALVLKHWTKETAYSFPSGHAYTAMLVATFFLSLALSFVRGPRMLFFYGLVIWAVAVCYTRPILRVHTPTDITIGGITGVVVGFLGFIIVRWFLDRLRP